MKKKIKELSNLIFQCLQITEACGIKNRELDTRLWKVDGELKLLYQSQPNQQPQVNWEEIEWIKTEINLLMSKNTYPDHTDLKKLWHKVNDFIRKNKLQPKEEEVRECE